jgi:hypothetical protein
MKRSLVLALAGASPASSFVAHTKAVKLWTNP